MKASEDLKPKEQTKPIEDNTNNQPKAMTIFNEFFDKRKELMSELFDSVDYNSLKCVKMFPTKSVSFYEYMDSKELYNAIKNNQIKFSEVKNKQNEFLNKLSNIKIGKTTTKQKEVINNLENFYNSREKIINFFRDYFEMLSDVKYDAKKNETKGIGLKILTPKHLKSTDNNDINIFMSLERKDLKIQFLTLIVSYHKIVQKNKLRHPKQQKIGFLIKYVIYSFLVLIERLLFFNKQLQEFITP